MKTYKTYQAQNAVKAAQVTNHIIAQKKRGVSHAKAKAEAYRIYNIKAAEPLLEHMLSAKLKGFVSVAMPPVPQVSQ